MEAHSNYCLTIFKIFFLGDLANELKILTRKQGVMLSMVTDILDAVKKMSLEIDGLKLRSKNPDTAVKESIFKVLRLPAINAEQLRELEEYLKVDIHLNDAVSISIQLFSAVCVVTII